MSCSHCEHCKAVTARRTLQLPDPPGNHGRGGMDVAFYLAFGRAYDRARALGPAPMRRLQTVNPWLTDSQCKSYLKRARQLGAVSSVSRPPAVTPAAPGPAPAAGTHPLAGTTLEPAWDNGIPISRAVLLRFVCADEDEADVLVQRLVDAGGTRTSDGVCRIPAVVG